LQQQPQGREGGQLEGREEKLGDGREDRRGGGAAERQKGGEERRTSMEVAAAAGREERRGVNVLC